MKKKYLPKKVFRFLASVMILTFAMASTVSAQSFSYSIDDYPIVLDDAYGKTDGSGYVLVTLEGTDYGWYTGYEFYPYGDDFSVEAFCIDSTQLDPDLTGYTLRNPDGTQMIDAALVASQYFYNEAFGYDRIATQLAIWEIMFEDLANDYDIAGGNFYLRDGADPDDVNAILTSIDDMTMHGHVAWADYTGSGEDNQDLLVATPVPEPATTLLIALGLLGIIGIGRKRFMKS